MLTEIGRADVCRAAAGSRTPPSAAGASTSSTTSSPRPWSSRTTAEWLAIFERLDIPSQPVRLPNDLLKDPHLADVGFFKPNFARATPVMRTLRQAMNVEAMTGDPDMAPPLLGADTADMLREAGCSEAEIAAVLPQRSKTVAAGQDEPARNVR